jgi:hypothetical protein
VSRVLFVMLHPGFIRYYDHALQELASAESDVHVAFEVTRDKLSEDASARRLASVSERITCGATPARPESVRAFLARSDRSATRSGGAAMRLSASEARIEAWESLATTVRLMLDFLRYFEPAFERASSLRDRAEKRLPRIYVRLIRLVAAGGPRVRAACAALLRLVERVIPPNPAVVAFLRDQHADLLVVTPLIELGSQQVDYVKAAGQLGLRSALAVASWDNLTSKGLIRVVPDHVIVWNDAQKDEAVTLHGVPADRVRVTGAQVFDRWFDAAPSRTREQFCRDVGLDPSRPFLLYVGSSSFIAPEEVSFFERWLSRLRAEGHGVVPSAGVLVRPHPANSRQWRALDRDSLTNVALWPPIGTDYNQPGFHRDFFDSLYHSAAVVGINTSALIEAGIVGRPVFTITAPEFAHGQEGTLHFHHVANPRGGLVRSAATLDEHVAQLEAALGAEPGAAESDRQFIRAFIRPLGLDQPAAPVFAHTIETLAGLPRPAVATEPWWIPALRLLARPLASVARTLAEDRPLWVYAARPVIGSVVWTWGSAAAARDALRDAMRSGRKRTRRGVHRARHDVTEEARRKTRRMNKLLARGVRGVGSAARRAVRRQV